MRQGGRHCQCGKRVRTAKVMGRWYERCPESGFYVSLEGAIKAKPCGNVYQDDPGLIFHPALECSGRANGKLVTCVLPVVKQHL